MEMDQQAIERRDFPVVRRGYDPASVDAHLNALAAAIEELRAEASGAGRETLASVAGAQVQGILEAAQASAESIVRDASELATRTREEADAAARATREQAIATARERVAAVTQATEALLQRVGSIDGEARTLVESLRGGAGRLVDDLEALSADMGGLYDAAAGRAGADEGEGAAGKPAAQVPCPPAPTPEPPADEPAKLAPPAPPEAENGAAVGDDLDGARLVALNMALNGDSREATAAYLAESFQLPDTEKLLDEVYAAIEA